MSAKRNTVRRSSNNTISGCVRGEGTYQATSGTIEQKLGKYAYKAVTDMMGTPHVHPRAPPQTDELYTFENDVTSHVLEEIDKFWNAQKDYQDPYGFMYNRGIIMYGPPAQEKRRPFIRSRK